MELELRREKKDVWLIKHSNVTFSFHLLVVNYLQYNGNKCCALKKPVETINF